MNGVEPPSGGRPPDPDPDRPLRAGEAQMTVEEAFAAAPLGPGARLVTVLAALTAVGGAALVVLSLPRGLAVLVGAPSLLVVLIALPLAFSPSGYAVGRAELAVLRRAARPLLFPLGSLVAARPTAMPRSYRLLGSGGLFGWWGRFSNPRGWGRFKAYATDRRRGVLLEWPGFKLFVSPEDPQALCRAVLARRHRAGGPGAARRQGRRP